MSQFQLQVVRIQRSFRRWLRARNFFRAKTALLDYRRLEQEREDAIVRARQQQSRLGVEGVDVMSEISLELLAVAPSREEGDNNGEAEDFREETEKEAYQRYIMFHG